MCHRRDKKGLAIINSLYVVLRKNLFLVENRLFCAFAGMKGS